MVLIYYMHDNQIIIAIEIIENSARNNEKQPVWYTEHVHATLSMSAVHKSTWANMAQKTTNESDGNHHHDKAFKCIYYGERIS